MPELMQRFACSQRNALRVVKMSASTYLYMAVQKDESVLNLGISCPCGLRGAAKTCTRRYP